MKAAVYDRNGGPDVLRFDDVADPVVRPHGLVVEVRAIGLQGGDLINRSSGTLVTQPHVVGYQASGVVREVGPDVAGFHPGQRVAAVMMHGSHAERASVAARKAWPIPDGLSFEQAASVPIEFGTASDCLFEFGRLSAGETVLVRGGSGGVGIAAVQLAKAAGAWVIATTRGADRLARLTELGAHHAVDETDDVAAAVARLTEGRGADLVVDPVGGRVLESSIAALAYRGRVSWVGNAAAHTTPPDLWPLMEKNGQVNALFFAMEQSRQPERTYRLIGDLLSRVASGELTAVIDRSFPLADAAAAHRYAEDEPTFGRVVLIP
jgi:NADPH2:quinone reductase